MKEPRISVAMATYNGERFLQEQLDSLARQTLLPLELVACDDGSTDGTLDILHRFAAVAPFEVKIYQNPERLGYCDNFLRAVGFCEGDLVAFSDQDDVWLPRKLAACAERFDSERIAMVIHLAMLAGPDLEPLGRTWPHLGRFGKELPRVSTLQYMDVAGMTMVFRREVAEPLSRDAALRRAISQAFAGHDQAMRCLAGAYGCVVPLREVLALHRCHDRNTSKGHGAIAVTAPAFIFGVQGTRARLIAATHWLKTHTGLARRAGWHSYDCEADALRRKAEALHHAAARAGEPLRAMLERSSTVLSRRADALTDRSYLYRDRPGKALTRFCRMVLRGQYRRCNRGGLGFWSLGKDSSLLFRSSRQRTAA